MVSLERFPEVGLVQLAAAAISCGEGRGVGLQASDQAVAHGEGRLQAHPATPGALPQRQRQDEALGIGRPRLLGKLARAEDLAGPRSIFLCGGGARTRGASPRILETPGLAV